MPLKAVNEYYTGLSQFLTLILSEIDGSDVLNYRFWRVT